MYARWSWWVALGVTAFQVLGVIVVSCCDESGVAWSVGLAAAAAGGVEASGALVNTPAFLCCRRSSFALRDLRLTDLAALASWAAFLALAALSSSDEKNEE